MRVWNKNKKKKHQNSCDCRSSYQLTVRTQHCSSHCRCGLPHFPSLLLLSCYGKGLRVQPLWASSQPAATTPIHDRRMEGSPKLKALLSLVAGDHREAERQAYFIVTRVALAFACGLCPPPPATLFRAAGPGPSRTTACQLDLKHKACTDSRIQPDCFSISHSASVSVIPNLLFFSPLLSQFCLSPKMSL